MSIKIIDPIEYPEWDSLLLACKGHSFFHSSAWAKVLKESYGYQPKYFVSMGSGRLDLAMPMMEVVSSLTGKRGVSLPFTDQCPPYALKKELIPEAVQRSYDYGRKSAWRYIEWRDGCCFPESAVCSETYYIHEIDVTKSDRERFALLRESNRRSIRKAVRSGVVVEIGRSPELVRSFYRLHCRTRKRHGLPPQPFLFFRNICNHIVSKNLGIIVSATHDHKPLASAVFFHFGENAIFKYGASELASQGFRPNNLVMWEAIKWYNEQGLKSLNLGRTSEDNLGLLRYKRLWGGEERKIEYHRYDLAKSAFVKRASIRRPMLNSLLALMPMPALRLTGRFLYRHAG